MSLMVTLLLKIGRIKTLTLVTSDFAIFFKIYKPPPPNFIVINLNPLL